MLGGMRGGGGEHRNSAVATNVLPKSARCHYGRSHRLACTHDAAGLVAGAMAAAIWVWPLAYLLPCGITAWHGCCCCGLAVMAAEVMVLRGNGAPR